MKMSEKTEAELKEIAKQKNKKNVATQQALRAQEELWQRNHFPETDYHRTYMYDFDGNGNR